MTRQITFRRAIDRQWLRFRGIAHFKALAASMLCLLTLPMIGTAEDRHNFEGYDPDVAALLEEFHAGSDEVGSMLPSVLAYQGQSNAETLIDFERGLISITASGSNDLKQAAVEILLTQVDPSIIDAATASDLGLINAKTEKPFLFNQVIDQDGLPIASTWRDRKSVV